MNKLILALLALTAFATTATVALADGPQHSSTSFEGEANQATQAGIEKGNLQFNNKGFYTGGSGAEAYGQESASASYKGKSGMGMSAVFGETDLSAYSFSGDGNKSYHVSGTTASVAIAAVTPGSHCSPSPNQARINGSGSLGTFAAIDNPNGQAVAVSSGEYSYKGQVKSGAVIGGGLTAGSSSVGSSSNHVSATSSQITTSGVGTMHHGYSNGSQG